MRRRMLMLNTMSQVGEISVKDTLACDVVFYNPNESRLIIRREEKYWKREEIPIGIVVIPASHGVLKDGTGKVNHCGVMSLVPMNYDTPEKGGNSEQNISWGYDNGSISRGISDGLGRADSVTNGLQSYTDTGYIRRQDEINGIPSWKGSPHFEGPYNDTSSALSSERNENYGITGCTSDFKGIINTKILTDLATEQSDWKTANTIIDNSGNRYAPAACCCARFKTYGTKSFVECTIEELRNGTGFWYFPAVGELGYIIPRMYDINYTIRKLNTVYSIGVTLATTSYYWTSSENNYRYSYFMSTSQGKMDYFYKSNHTYVRAFMQLSQNYINNIEQYNGYEFIDLGLSVKWATWNIGATKPEERGYYFQWAGTTPYNFDRTPVGGGSAIRFDLDHCPYYVRGTVYVSKWSKYTAESKFSSTGIADNKLILEPEDDAAHVHIGGECRMPTEEEYQELFNACNTKMVENYNNTGINGMLFILKNNPSKTLFFPATGYLNEGYSINGRYDVYLWCSSLSTDWSYAAQYIILDFEDVRVRGVTRDQGYIIRAVLPK